MDDLAIARKRHLVLGKVKLEPLGLTRHQYASSVVAKLGKGYQHASLLYSEWCRKGTLEGRSKAFANAAGLRRRICDLTNATVPELVKVSQEGKTKKFLLRLQDGLETESVLIPMQSGWTLCVSSQVGCKMGCAFCETGKMGLIRHLSAAEIVAQSFAARHKMATPVRNIVFMGMGEPLDNFDAVIQAIRVLCDPRGFGFSPRNITVSTCGLVEGIYRLIDEGPPSLNLAVSVNAPSDAVRQRLMPVNRHHDMAALRQAMEAYCARPKRKILAEYVLIRGVNDSDPDAQALALYLRGLPLKINLIPYNPQSRDLFDPPSEERMDAFAATLRQAGYRVLLRKPKGQAIMGACGQLGNRRLRRALVKRGCHGTEE